MPHGGPGSSVLATLLLTSSPCLSPSPLPTLCHATWRARQLGTGYTSPDILPLSCLLPLSLHCAMPHGGPGSSVLATLLLTSSPCLVSFPSPYTVPCHMAGQAAWYWLHFS
ncbi:hypothetical protein RRG08_061335 [Elysia crispata]|uniref:Secreted protein n=1 Tax=Elysia crispata TaxID=231223 RepID=A0AAE1AF50_9GAST|nr:hypothetical protein RRG08_061335 [Elysia crispata]